VIYFFDTSALVKYYVTEPGSTWVRTLVDSRSPLFLVEITLVEMAAALEILHRVGRLSRRRCDEYWQIFEEDCVRRYQWLPVSRLCIETGATLCRRYPLKGYDAVQVAIALHLQQVLSEQELCLTFVSSDHQALDAAEAEGLLVENPFDHVVESE
jgi:predicted nucleic acid-binding protein